MTISVLMVGVKYAGKTLYAKRVSNMLNSSLYTPTYGIDTYTLYINNTKLKLLEVDVYEEAYIFPDVYIIFTDPTEFDTIVRELDTAKVYTRVVIIVNFKDDSILHSKLFDIKYVVFYINNYTPVKVLEEPLYYIVNNRKYMHPMNIIDCNKESNISKICRKISNCHLL